MVKASNFIRLGQWNVNEKVKRKKGKEKWKNKQTKKKTVTTDNQRLIYLIVVSYTLSLLIWTSPRAKYQRKDSQYYEKGTDLG